MSHRYNAFVMRQWSRENERGERAELTHVQTGERTRVTSVTAAIAWIHAQGASEGAAPETAACGQAGGRDDS